MAESVIMEEILRNTKIAERGYEEIEWKSFILNPDKKEMVASIPIRIPSGLPTEFFEVFLQNYVDNKEVLERLKNR